MFESADLWLLRALYAGDFGHPWLDVILAITFVGSGWMMFGLVPVLFLRSMRLQSAALLVTVAVTSVVVASVKALFGRVRPCHALDWLHAIPIVPPIDPSFPSGHAAGSFAFASFVFAFHRRAGVALAFLAMAVAFSRVALGVHYPSDVVAGALLGAALGALGARMNARFAFSRGAITPAVMSAAVGLTDANSESTRQ